MIVSLSVVAPLALSVGCILYASTLEAKPGKPRRSPLTPWSYYARRVVAYVAIAAGVAAALTVSALIVVGELT